ncbi:helix-turn-helix domain-containing protein [Microcoleus sp. Pol11C3]|uniref:helix-turn-helix domain-containing protein n=1 Tax=Microcoleus sp. Pol11C3 TaxID=3055390 RepID=UPI002FCF9DD9
MKKPRSLTSRERNLIAIYSQCQLGMTPRQFYAKWGVTHEEIAFICSRSNSTVRGWFKRDKSRRFPTAVDLRHLAVMDFLLEHFEEIPGELRSLLCPPSQS